MIHEFCELSIGEKHNKHCKTITTLHNCNYFGLLVHSAKVIRYVLSLLKKTLCAFVVVGVSVDLYIEQGSEV